MNIVRAAVTGLSEMKNIQDVARLRGKRIEEIWS
ncbi:MAG: hypothetical protein ACLT3C_02925 [Peptococcus niger]